MPPQRLHLSWKDHNGALVVILENFLKRNSLVDCTLAAEGQYLKAHKVVLAACSSYFELLFSQESEKNPIVILKDVKFQELEAAVNFMYRGEVEVFEDRLAAFLEVADSLQIKGLGSEGRAQVLRGKSPTLKSKKVAVPPKSHSRKDFSFNQSENIGNTSIILDSDKNSNESSLQQQLPHRETSSAFPIPSSLPMASASILARGETHHDGELLENYQCSSVSVFPPGDSVPPDVNTVIKTEPSSDLYFHEKSDESERDFEDVTIMEDQEDWDDPNIESVGGDQATNSHDPEYSVAHMKTEEPSSEQVSSGPTMEHISSEGRAGSGRPWRASRRGRFQCSHCGYSTSKASHWAMHQRVHTGERPFKCSVCPYASTQSGRLKEHMRKHTGERPFKCTICSYAMASAGNLKRHVQRHSGMVP